MAKHPKRRNRKFRRYLKGQIDLDFALGTIAKNAMVSAATPDTVIERTLVTSIVASYAYGEHTPDQGPFRIGVAHSDYSATEILEWVDNAGSWSEADLVGKEVSARKIREIGVFTGALAQGRLNDGKPIKTKLNWILTTGQTLDFWVINEDDSSFTTGTDVTVNGHANLWPQ